MVLHQDRALPLGRIFSCPPERFRRGVQTLAPLAKERAVNPQATLHRYDGTEGQVKASRMEATTAVRSSPGLRNSDTVAALNSANTGARRLRGAGPWPGAR
jgi:hypothetical protein